MGHRRPRRAPGLRRGVIQRGGTILPRRAGCAPCVRAPGVAGGSRRGSTSWTARLVVNAAGAWADRVPSWPAWPRSIWSLDGVGCAPRRLTRPPGCAARIRWSWHRERWYFRPEARRAGLPGGRRPGPPGDAKPDEAHIARSLEAVNEVTRLGLRSVRAVWAGCVRSPGWCRCRDGPNTQGSGSTPGRAATASRWPRPSLNSRLGTAGRRATAVSTAPNFDQVAARRFLASVATLP